MLNNRRYMDVLCIIALFAICNIGLYYMQYSASYSIILRFIPSWNHVILVGNAVIASLLVVVLYIKKKYADKTPPYIDIYIIAMILFIGVALLAGMITHGKAIKSMLVAAPNDTFMDFFNSMQYGWEPYSEQVIYPPLINLFYALCGSMILPMNELAGNSFYMRETQMGMMVLYGVTLLTMMGISVIICQFINGETKRTKTLFLLVIFFSLPFMFAIERANSLLQTVLFLLIFLYWYKSNDKKRRYASYVALGVAVGIKISPIIFGLLVLRHSGWRESIKAVIIVFFLFYVPFFFLDGDLGVLISNVKYTTSLMQGSFVNEIGSIQNIGNGVYVNLWNTLDTFGRIYNINLWNLSKVLTFLILLMPTICILFLELEEWKIVALLSLMVILLPGFSAVYSLCYMILPLVIFLRDYGSKSNGINYAYLSLFICIFMPIVNLRFSAFAPFKEDTNPMCLSTIVESCALLIMIFLLLSDIIYQIDKKARSKILGGISVAIALYIMSIIIIHKPAVAFIPGDMSIINSSAGMVLDEGRYCGIKPNGKLNLQTDSIKKEGLVIAGSESIADENINLYMNGNIVISHRVNGGNWCIYLPAEQIQKLDLKDSVDIGLSYSNSEEFVHLSYAGKPRTTDVISSGTFIDDISEGLWRKPGEGTLRMGKEAHFLIAGETASEGMLLRYYVPSRLISSNPGKEISLELYADGDIIKKIPISDSKMQIVVLQASEIIKEGNVPDVVDLMIKCNATYRESDDGESLDTHDQSIIVLSAGSIKSESAYEAKWLSGVEKKYLAADDLKKDGFSLLYQINPGILEFIQNNNLQLNVIVDGVMMSQKELLSENSDCLNGVYLEPEKFIQKESIVCAEVSLTQNGNIPYELLSKYSELLMLSYMGSNKIENDYIMDDDNAKTLAMTGIKRDSTDKKTYLDQVGEILFLKRDMLGHDLVLDYEVPPYLLANGVPILEIKLHDKVLWHEMMEEPGRASIRIPSEQLKNVLLEDKQEVLSIRLVMNKVFNPALHHIFGIGGGNKSIIIHRVFTD